ncbi:Gfo/Idh/MocA family protein [Paenibacillus thermotolerans]|uniref:Gfo/Idh/MocA family protein n=1 Tax=Paenibacillus thermotolerans TaxID=3027807 RepID=UPI002368E3F5|nr:MULTISPECIES: Gfo/Idh/MocA family oxidoreductase [unclassified Paenibacillus]
MAEGKMRVGLIGLGGMANHHIWLLSKIDEAEITAICDVNPEALRNVGENLGVSARYEDYASIVKDPNVDCIISVVPNKFHAEIIDLCIGHGKPLMTEKPFTVTFEEAKALKTKYDRSPIRCMVGFSYRYVPAFRYAKELLEQGELGEIRHIAVEYLQQWGAELFDTPYSWRFSKEMSGSGALGDLGAHMIDSARYFAGQFTHVAGLLKTFVPERKLPGGSGETAEVDVDDFTAFVAGFENGAAGVFTTSRNAVGFGNHLEVTIYGTKGTVQVNSEYPRTVKRWSRRDGEVDSNVSVSDVPERFELNQLQDFLNFARGKDTKDTPTFTDGYENQKIIDLLIQSSAKGVRMDL